jgi:hypothetical protein
MTELIEVSNSIFAEPPKTDFYENGALYGEGVVGFAAKFFNDLAVSLRAPSGYFLSLFSRAVLLDFCPGNFMQATSKVLELCVRIMSFSLGVFGFAVLSPIYIISMGISGLCSMRKKDFVVCQSVEGAPLKKVDSLSVLSFNMGLLPEFISIRNKLSSPLSRAKKIPQELKTGLLEQNKKMPDLILGQEVFDEPSSLSLCKDFKNLGYSTIVYDVGPKAFGLNSGLFLASRYKLSNIMFFSHPFVSDNTESWANKGVLFATAEVGEKKVVVSLTHFNGAAPEGAPIVRATQGITSSLFMDYYLNLHFKNESQLGGAFFSGDYNIAPIIKSEQERSRFLNSLGIDPKEHELFDVIDPEWFLSSLIDLDQNDEKLDELIERFQCFKELKLEDIKLLIQKIKSSVPKMWSRAGRGDWREFFILTQNLLEKISPVAILKSDLDARIDGGSMPSRAYLHDLKSYKDAQIGSSINMNLYLNDGTFKDQKKAIEDRSRIDFNMIRTNVGFEQFKEFKVPKHSKTEILSLSEVVSDHRPVVSYFDF